MQSDPHRRHVSYKLATPAHTLSDRIFLSKNASSTQDIIHKIVEGSDKTEKETLNLRNTVTMSGLLNAIDGVTAQVRGYPHLSYRGEKIVFS